MGPPVGRKLRRWFQVLLCTGGLVLGVGASSVLTSPAPGASAFSLKVAWAAPGTAELIHRLKNSSDFRVRMQAALELGKSKALNALEPLQTALKDSSAAVRAAAAAALRSLGDSRALPALRLALSDDSDAVKNQVRSTIAALESISSATCLVELGAVDTGAEVAEKGVVDQYFGKITRRKLGQVRGVLLKDQSAPGAAALPEFVMDARLQRLSVKPGRDSTEVFAKVDLVLSRQPGRVIKGRLSGSATVHGEADVGQNPSDLKRLRFEAIEAATDSALVNAERALRAAAE